MSALDEVRRAVLAAFDEVVKLADGELPATRRAMLEAGRARLRRGRYHVVVCGEFRRGKSSLLNALVERPRLFPVDIDVTTATVSMLRWGPQERAFVVYNEDDPQNPGMPLKVEVDISDAAAYVTEQANPGNTKKVARLVMELPLEQLSTGLVLVDTPGAGSVNLAHTAATRAFLPNADAVLFVGSAVEPFSTVELDLLRLALQYNPIVITAITMIDKVADPAAAAARARARIAEHTATSPDLLTVVPVSSFRKRDALDDEDPDLLAESGFPELERALWDGLAVACGAAQLSNALDALDSAVTDALAPIANERAALQGGEQFARIDEELKAARTRAAGFRSAGARWRSDLQDDLERAARPIRERMAADFDAIRTAFVQELRGTGRWRTRRASCGR
ncbi:dynamin family protein [Dactylosporangium darangshiense]|uniref:dynamin family protein n=1 Tax=Dactylosporangium darangshiense TaxID=579108 RepID=UPI0036387035